MKKRKIGTFIFVFLMSVFLSSGKVFAVTEPIRLGGADRYETAVKISQDKWEQANDVVLVSGEDFPDALCATPLAKKLDAPILLSKRDSLEDKTREELVRLKVQHVSIVGGIGAIGEKVENEIKDMGIEVRRIGGADRYETAVQVAQVVGITNKIIIVSGASFPDAISISSIAAQNEIPILLTGQKQLPESAKEYLKDKTLEYSYLIGGPAVVSEEIKREVPNSKRIYGMDRYETNIAVIREFADNLSFNTLYVASGNNFVDALTGSGAAAKVSSPVVLTNGQPSAEARAYIKEKLDTIKNVRVLGGESIVSGISVRKLMGEILYRIVLDPGHGGFDPGAIGASGSQEKDVNLAVALKVGKILENNGVEAIYTRNSDVLPWESNKTADLQSRSDLSNTVEPDYFVSIHSNSNSQSWANGTATYYKNGSEESFRLAKSVQDELVKAIGTKDNGVLTEDFSVLRKTNSPAILVELAFISNPSEEALLGSESFQNKAAEGIARGIIQSLK